MNRTNYPLFNAINYSKRNAVSIDNYQKMFGLRVEVMRIRNRETEKHMLAYGPSKVNLKSNDNLEHVKDIDIISTPTELYNTYQVGSGNGETTIYCHKNELVIGDIIRYRWKDNQVLEFVVIETPTTFGSIYFEYKVKTYSQVQQ